MKIRQEKQIKAFLISEFGDEKGNVLYEKQGKILKSLIENTKGKTENQMKTLSQTILPRIALYKILSNESLAGDEVYRYMRKYKMDIVAVKKYSSTAKMEVLESVFFRLWRGSARM
ncbi:hypothetical protein DW159_02555 [Coprococcus sp. AM14-16]|uniref:hypothetical protein n=1 Tax=Coprococcus TaxID=33042 RepID=UPI000E404A8C|nr:MULTISPECIES: hypothetical protein [Coprococcus]RGD40903.1 hypothetical protein DW159_02555 [Coprococcus sp. AM14-16]